MNSTQGAHENHELEAIDGNSSGVLIRQRELLQSLLGDEEQLVAALDWEDLRELLSE